MSWSVKDGKLVISKELTEYNNGMLTIKLPTGTEKVERLQNEDNVFWFGDLTKETKNLLNENKLDTEVRSGYHSGGGSPGMCLGLAFKIIIVE